tara:strand:- start:19003 stop:19935 length:933 start_codon:yes stop_codon:yes gene_type:complete
MKLTVLILVYNHGEFLDKCLKSVFFQKCSFDFEVLVGEDCSTDNSLEICKKFEEKYPRQFKLFRRRKNIGMLKNFYDLIENATGEYTVFLEGDDFWTNINKLEWQVKALESNLDCNICYHNVKMFFEKGLVGNEKLYVKKKQPLKVGVETVIESEVFMHTSSLMIRTEMIKNSPPSFLDYSMADIPITIFALRDGSFAFYLDEVMSCYRKNIGGITFKLNKERIKTVKNYILMYRDLNELLGFRYNKNFMYAELKKFLELTSLYIKNENYTMALVYHRICNKYLLVSDLKLLLKRIFNKLKIVFRRKSIY